MAFWKKHLIVLVLACWCQAANAQIGSTAPDFTAVDTHGDTIHLYEILNEGKYVILDFFFTTCGPCIYYSPQVNLAYEKYGCNTQDVVFISVDYGDTNAEVLAYDAKYNIEYPSIGGQQGGGNAIVSQYGISGFPTFYLIDSTHTIIDKIDPPTLQVFDFRFGMHGIVPQTCLTAVSEGKGQAEVRIYPNPAVAERAALDLTGLDPGSYTLRVSDFTGRQVASHAVHNDSGSRFELGTGSWPAGIYQLALSTADGRIAWAGRLVVAGF